MTSSTTPIFHHYNASPFSEKVRLIFGLKNIEWQSVDIPVIMPKPDLMPLTGGYRKTPVMQIGSDIYCDTQIIIRELENRYPDPTLFPAGDEGLAYGLSMWTDRTFFQTTIPIIFGAIADFVPDDFVKDRQELFPDRPFDKEAMKVIGPLMRDQWRAQIDWLDIQLKDGRYFLTGAQAGLADVHAYMPVWFLKNAHAAGAEELLEQAPHCSAWADRLAGLGHGTKTDLSSKDALTIALNTEPETIEQIDRHEPNGYKPGDLVSVSADDYGRDAITGTLVSSSAQHIAIKREDEAAGNVVVHFPRVGFIVKPA